MSSHYTDPAAEVQRLKRREVVESSNSVAIPGQVQGSAEGEAPPEMTRQYRTVGGIEALSGLSCSHYHSFVTDCMQK